VAREISRCNVKLFAVFMQALLHTAPKEPCGRAFSTEIQRHDIGIKPPPASGIQASGGEAL